MNIINISPRPWDSIGERSHLLIIPQVLGGRRRGGGVQLRAQHRHIGHVHRLVHPPPCPLDLHTLLTASSCKPQGALRFLLKRLVCAAWTLRVAQSSRVTAPFCKWPFAYKEPMGSMPSPVAHFVPMAATGQVSVQLRTDLRISFASSWLVCGRSSAVAELLAAKPAQQTCCRPLPSNVTLAGTRGSCHGRGLQSTRVGFWAGRAVLALCMQPEQRSAAEANMV